MFKTFFPGSVAPKQLAERELSDAQRALLEAKSAQEYTNAMVTYHEARVRRLTAYVGGAV